MQAMDGPRMAGIVNDVMEGIQEEMLAAMSSHIRNAAAACGDVCAARLRMLQTALSRHLDEARRQQMIGGAPLTPGFAAAQQVLNGPVDTKRVAIRQIRAKLESQGDTPASFLRARSVAANQGLLSRDEFVACIASLNLSISHADILEIFASAVGSTDRDTAILDEITQALDSVPLGGSAGGCAAATLLSPEAERVVGRVRSAVGRSGRPFEEVFRGFCRSGGRGAVTMNRADLARVLSTFEPDIDPEVVARLWRLTVPDGAQGLDFSNFCAWFCPGGRALSGQVSAVTPIGGLSESQMLSTLLEKSGMQRSRSPSPMSASMPNLCHLGFDQLPVSPGARMSSTLTPEQLLSADWRQDRPRNAWPTWPALEVGCTQPPPSARLSPLLQDDFPAMACLSRLNGYLAAKGLTLNFAFVLYDTHMEQAVTQEGFMSAIEHHGFPISKAEAEAIFTRLARRKANQVLCLYFEDLQSCIASLPNPLPQGKDLIKSVDKITRSQGTPLETLFRHLGTDSVTEWDVRAILSRYSPLSSAQWANLLPLLDKNSDGTVPWQSVLKWAGLDGVPGVPNGAVPAPVAPAPAVPVPAAPAVPAVPAQPVSSPPPPTPPVVRPATMPAVPVGPASSLSPPAPPPAPAVAPLARPLAPIAPLTSPPPPLGSRVPPPMPPVSAHAVGVPPPPGPPGPLAPVSSPLARPFPPALRS
ncbi:unnamed protein product [Cladocopium goreaui]|uniref:WD repeat-containing protein 35 n=1 Tax=Cladocopium goreaui TaxID=2562237 RepID=A0A9P1G5D2_9DINO|nr:unnamed protein product [Cladocopium goreaui]